MYTEEMARAFHSIRAPKNFDVQLVDNEHFIAVKADEKQFMRLDDYGKRQAVEYLVRVKSALEQNGAVVLIVREAAE
jgi:hypothetical protein